MRAMLANAAFEGLRAQSQAHQVLVNYSMHEPQEACGWKAVLEQIMVHGPASALSNAASQASMMGSEHQEFCKIKNVNRPFPWGGLQWPRRCPD